MNMQHERTAWERNMDMQQGHAEWTYSMGKQHEHAAWTSSMYTVSQKNIFVVAVVSSE
jgi:hypothetical protein